MTCWSAEKKNNAAFSKIIARPSVISRIFVSLPWASLPIRYL